MIEENFFEKILDKARGSMIEQKSWLRESHDED